MNSLILVCVCVCVCMSLIQELAHSNSCMKIENHMDEKMKKKWTKLAKIKTSSNFDAI